VIGFFWQSRKVYDAYLAKAIPTLSEAQLIAATPKLERLKFEPGQVIIRQGDPADRFYIITRGGVDVVRQGPDGQEQVVNRLSQGQYFGEIGLLHGGKRIATCRAIDEVELLALDRATFGGLMSESNTSKQELDRIVRQRVLQTRAVQGGD
jgi:putative ABC transport system ATP-binding protein